jgi:hypothetical protein
MASDFESMKWDSDTLEMYSHRSQFLMPTSKGNIEKGKR